MKGGGAAQAQEENPPGFNCSPRPCLTVARPPPPPGGDGWQLPPATLGEWGTGHGGQGRPERNPSCSLSPCTSACPQPLSEADPAGNRPTLLLGEWGDGGGRARLSCPVQLPCRLSAPRGGNSVWGQGVLPLSPSCSRSPGAAFHKRRAGGPPFHRSQRRGATGGARAYKVVTALRQTAGEEPEVAGLSPSPPCPARPLHLSPNTGAWGTPPAVPAALAALWGWVRAGCVTERVKKRRSSRCHPTAAVAGGSD